MKILLFGELVSSNNFLFFLLEKLHLINIFTGLGTYLQGIPIQNTADFVWGTDSGIRTLPVSFYLFLLQLLSGNNWYWVYLLLIIILPFFCFFLALRIYKRIDIFVLLGAIFYTANTWIINRLLSGYWQLNLVYSFLPFLITIPLYFAYKPLLTRTSLLFWSTLLAFFASVVMTSQPHFLIMVSLFLVLHFLVLLFSKNYIQVKNLLLLYGTTFVEFLLINIYFFIPGVLFSEKLFTAPNQYFSIGSVIFNGLGSTLFHVLQLSPVSYPFIAHQTNFVERIQFLQLGLVIFFFIWGKKKEWTLFFSLAVFVFLAKGVNPPLEQISDDLYRYIPILHFFRDPTRFIGAVVLFGSLIIGFYTRKQKFSLLLNVLLTSFFVFILFTANWRIISSSFGPTFTETNIPTQYISMQKFINANPGIGRLLILPNKSGYAGYSFYHDTPLPASYTVYDMVLTLQVPIADSSNYPDNYSSQMSALTYDRFTKDYNTHILQQLGITYVLTDSSISGPISEYGIATVSAKNLLNLPDMQLKKSIKNLDLFTYTGSTPLVVTEKPIFAIGNLDTILRIHEQGITRPVILLNQSVNVDSIQEKILQKQDLYIDNENPILTLTAEELAKKYSVNILKAAWDYDKSLTNCEPYKMEYIVPVGNLFTSGMCVGSGNKTGDVSVPVNIPKGRYKVLLKAMDTNAPSQLAITISNKTIYKKIDTNSILQWMDLGTQSINDQQNHITIHVKDKNKVVIDYLVFIPIDAWSNTIKMNKTLIQRMNTVTMHNLENSLTSNVYTIGINSVTTTPTKYLTYRLSWGKWWSSNKPAISFISDGYAMTFIATNGTISSIHYFPDTVYFICITISACIIITLIAYCIWYAFSGYLKQ